jgi:hypothetical protein
LQDLHGSDIPSSYWSELLKYYRAGLGIVVYPELNCDLTSLYFGASESINELVSRLPGAFSPWNFDKGDQSVVGFPAPPTCFQSDYDLSRFNCPEFPDFDLEP